MILFEVFKEELPNLPPKNEPFLLLSNIFRRFYWVALSGYLLCIEGDIALSLSIAKAIS